MILTYLPSSKNTARKFKPQFSVHYISILVSASYLSIIVGFDQDFLVFCYWRYHKLQLFGIRDLIYPVVVIYC